MTGNASTDEGGRGRGTVAVYLGVLAALGLFTLYASRLRAVPPLDRPEWVAGAAVDGRIYLAGGRDGQGELFDALHRIDPDPPDVAGRGGPPTARIRRVAALPSPRFGAAAAAAGGRLFIAGRLRREALQRRPAGLRPRDGAPASGWPPCPDRAPSAPWPPWTAASIYLGGWDGEEAAGRDPGRRPGERAGAADRPPAVRAGKRGGRGAGREVVPRRRRGRAGALPGRGAGDRSPQRGGAARGAAALRARAPRRRPRVEAAPCTWRGVGMGSGSRRCCGCDRPRAPGTRTRRGRGGAAAGGTFRPPRAGLRRRGPRGGRGPAVPAGRDGRPLPAPAARRAARPGRAGGRRRCACAASCGGERGSVGHASGVLAD